VALSRQSRDNFIESIRLFDSRVEATLTDRRWSAPSPCEGWAAGDVVAHLVANLRSLRIALGGGDFFDGFGKPVEGDLAEAWATECREAVLLLDGTEPDTVTVRGNQVPLAVIVDGLMRDLVIHTWDFARAVGGDERLPDDLVAAATEAMAMVGDSARGPGFYGQIVPVPDDASARTRLLGLSGRSGA
jgi:uncharacterized protein (TIGR03086 family)